MICQLKCGRRAEHRHHLFSKTKWAVNLYGKLIDDRRNILLLCSTCHLNKAIPKWDERQFCEALNIIPRSKTFKGKALEK